MDEKRFCFDQFMRHLPPLPKLPDEVAAVLRQADECLALGQAELAMQALAVLAHSALGHDNGPIERPALDANMALYLADCHSAVAAHLPGASGRDGAADPAGDSLAIITPTIEPRVLGSVIVPVVRRAVAAGWRVLVMLTNEQAKRSPTPRLWRPDGAAAAWGEVGGDWGAERVALKPNGGLLESAAEGVERLAAFAPGFVLAAASLRTPVTAAMLVRRAAPIQVNLATAEPAAVAGVDAVWTVYTPDDDLTRRLTARGIGVRRLSDVESVTDALTTTPRAEAVMPGCAA